MSERGRIASGPRLGGGGNAGPERRIGLLDVCRSGCVAVMLLYHTVYDLTLFGAVPATLLLHPLARLIRVAGASGFFVLAGMSARLSRAPARQGLTLFCAGALVSALTARAGMPVVFGALSLLGVCKMLCGALRGRLPVFGGPGPALCCALLALMTGFWTAGVRVSVRWLFPLGLRAPGFASADYYPLLPWGFVFLSGVCLGETAARHADAPLLRRIFPPALTFAGRHSLAIYLLHQPLLLSCCLLFLPGAAGYL